MKKKLINVQSSVTLSMEDFIRIKNSMNVLTPTDNIAKKNERKIMHDVAKTIVNNWPNTLDNLRKKKEEDKLKKLRDEEIKRREADIKELAFQHELRKEAIVKANDALNMQQDQIKAFSSKLKLADVMQERQMQLQLNDEKKMLKREIEANYVEMEKKKMKEYDENEKRKEEIDRKLKEKNNIAIREQWKESQLAKQKLQQETKIEGELVRKQVADELEKDYQKELDRKHKAIELQTDFLKTNENLKRAKEDLRKIEKEEERKVLEYAVEKDKLMNIRKKREEDKFKEKQAQRQEMIQKQIEVLRNMKSNEEKRLQKETEEIEEKEQKIFEQKLKREDEMKASIEKVRLAQLEKKRLEVQRKKEENLRLSSEFQNRMKEMVY